MHTNILNDKKYIGMTCQKLKRRFGCNGYKYQGCRKFYSAIKKYGWENFTHDILLENLTFKEACLFEKFFIKCYKSNTIEGYNIDNGGCYSDKISDEHRMQLSISHKGIKMSEKTKQKLRIAMKDRYGIKNPMFNKGKKIICLETGEIFNSIKNAGEKYKIDTSSISAVCKGKRKSCKDLHFCYLQNYSPDIKYELTRVKRRVICITTGEIFESISEATKSKKVTHISEVCSGKLKSTKGLIFRYLD